MPSDFEAKTRALLTEAVAAARKAKPCGRCPEGLDKAPCRLCADYRRKHAELDDLLDQLQADADLATLKPLDDFAPVFTPSKPVHTWPTGRRWSD